MRALILAIAVGLATLVAPAPAQAVTYVDVYADNVTVPNNSCRDTTITVSGDWSGYYNEVEIVIYDSYGDQIWSDYNYDYEGDSGGWFDFYYTACDGEPGGWYTVDVTVTEYDESYTVIGTMSADTEFKVTHRQPRPKKRSTVSLREYERYNQGPWYSAATGDLSIAKAPPRWDRRKPIHLWVRIGEWWFDVDSQRTNRKGKASWRFKGQANQYTWSMCYHGSRRVKPDCSRNFRPSRGSARMAVTEIVPAVIPGVNTRDGVPDGIAALVARP